MEKSFYAEKITEMLKDESTYRKLAATEQTNILRDLKKLINRHNDCLKEQEVDFILNFESKESNLYGLPKIHKSKIIKTAIKEQNSDYIIVKNPSDLKFRPIVAGPVSPTSRLSNVIDLILKQIPPQTNSYIRDDIDFLSKLKRDLHPNDDYNLTTFDVESLYTNIDHQLGITAVKYWIKKHPELINPRFSEEFISESIQFILENNTFYFNSEYYLQIKGTAMGTKMAPTYANLVLAYLEEMMYQKLLENKGEEYSNFIKNNFLRYLDDCFIIWPNNKYEIDEFTKILNNMHKNFNFIKETSATNIPFLDIEIQLESNIITTDIYYKATDTHQFLPFNSCHPHHTKTSIPYSQARRICTIVDNKDKLQNRLKEMKHFFLARGYPIQLVDDSIKKALAIPQHILRQKKDKQNKDVLPFVHTHNPNNPNVIPIVRSTLDILKYDERMRKVLQTSTFIASKRQAPNLGTLLTHARFSNTDNQNINKNNGSFKCHDKKCCNCEYINETNKLHITSTGRTFYIKHHLTCKSANVLYVITCCGCKEQYVGMTGNTLAKRFNVHRQHIREPVYRKLGVSKHLDECSSKDPKFTVTPFFKITNDKTQGQVKESLFIKQFEPKLNKLTLCD